MTTPGEQKSSTLNSSPPSSYNASASGGIGGISGISGISSMTAIGGLGGTKKMDDALPDWLDMLKTELLSTGQWGALVRDVYNGVTARLETNHIQFFSDFKHFRCSVDPLHYEGIILGYFKALIAFHQE